MTDPTTEHFRFPIRMAQLVGATSVSSRDGSLGLSHDASGIMILYEGNHPEYSGTRTLIISLKCHEDLTERLGFLDDGPNEIVFERIVYPDTKQKPQWRFVTIHLRRDVMFKS